MSVRTRIRIAAVLVVAGLPAIALAEEGGGGGAALLRPDPGTMFWTALTFLLMLFLLGRFAWKPLLGAVDARAASIRADIDQARQSREEAEALIAEHRALITAARRERAEAVQQGQRDAERIKNEILEGARREREQLLKQADVQLQGSLKQARGELRAMTADLAIRAAEKLLSSQLDGSAQRKLVEDYLADLERSSSPPS